MCRIFSIACVLLAVFSLSLPYHPEEAFAAKRTKAANALPPLTSSLDFTLAAHGPGEGPTVLIVGGIQGDEPGGFSAAALLRTELDSSILPSSSLRMPMFRLVCTKPGISSLMACTPLG